MKIQKINILSKEVRKIADAICFTSNGIIKKNGRLTMGAGVAKAFRDKFDGVDWDAAQAVKKNGNVCQLVVSLQHVNDPLKYDNIVAFPTKYHWRNPSDIKLITKSAHELVALADRNNWKNVYLPCPGCSNGGLNFKNDVKPVLEKILDDRFIICYL